jgi:hypothetical protein
MLRRCLLLLAVAATGCAKITVTHVAAPTNTSAEGVFYALPKTVVKPLVKIDKTTKTPARFSRFAEIFAPAVPAVCGSVGDCRTATTTTTYSVQQGATFSTFGEPDPAHVYMVKIDGWWTSDQTLAMAWTESGVATSAAATVTNRTLDVGLAGLKMAASLGTKLVFGAAGVEGAPPATCAQPSNSDPWMLAVLQGAADAGIRQRLMANYCDIEKDQRDRYQQGTDENLLKEALAAYQARVTPLLTARINTLTGAGAANILDRAALIGKQTEFIDAELKELFAGTSEKATWEATFDVRDVSLSTPQPLLTLNAAAICPGSLLAFDSKPVPSAFTVDCTKPALTRVTASFSLFPNADQQLYGTVQARVTTPGGDRAFRYRLPAQVRARIVGQTGATSTEYGNGLFAVAQHGIVVSLPARRNSKQLSYDLAFIEATGGLKSFKLGQTGVLDAAALDALSSAGGTVLDAGNAAAKHGREDRAKAAAAADELAILTREAALLKLRKEICDIQKEFGIACSIQQ